MKGFVELSMTLGVSFRIKCIVAAPHATWPRGACWLMELIAWPLGFPLFFNFLGLVFKLSSPSLFPIPLIICSEFFFFFSLLHLLLWPFRHCFGDILWIFLRLSCLFSRYVLLFFSLYFLFLHNLLYVSDFSFLFVLLWLFLVFGLLGFNPLLVFHGQWLCG